MKNDPSMESYLTALKTYLFSSAAAMSPCDCQPENKADYQNLSSSRVHYDPLPVFLLKSSGNAAT
jgi:hypothetical protein